MWKMFTGIYGNEPDALALKWWRYRCDERESYRDFSRHFHFLGANSTSCMGWITFLKLDGVRCSRATLTKISELSNLSALTVWSPNKERFNFKGADLSDQVDDRLFQVWAGAASKGAFWLLKVLACINQEGLTDEAFNHVSVFPELTTFMVTNREFAAKHVFLVKEHRWERELDTEHEKSVKSWVNFYFYKRITTSSDWYPALEGKSAQQRPILEMELKGLPSVKKREPKVLHRFSRLARRDTHEPLAPSKKGKPHGINAIPGGA